MTGREDRLPGGTLARIARRLVTPEAYQRVLSPLLADYQHEHRRAVGLRSRARVRVGWLLAFWRSLAVEGVRAGGLHLARNAWGTTEGERATTKLFVRCFPLAVVWVVFLMSIRWPSRALLGHAYLTPETPGLLALLLPSMLSSAFPFACLFGVLIAAHRRAGRDLRLRALIGVAALAGLATLANENWVTPETNYAFKYAILSDLRQLHPQLPITMTRADREMSVLQLAAGVADLRVRSPSSGAARRLEVEIHKKAALAAWCLVFVLLGAALARRIPWAVLRWGVAFAGFAAIFVLVRLGEEAADAGRVSPAVAMWTPLLATAALAVAALWRRRSPSGILTRSPSPR